MDVDRAYIHCMSVPPIKATDQEFFRALADVVYGNPFSKPRAELIVQLAPGADPWDLMRDPETLLRIVEPRLAPWRR